VEVEEERRGGVAEVEADLFGGSVMGACGTRTLASWYGDRRRGLRVPGRGRGGCVGNFGGVGGGGESHDSHEDGWQTLLRGGAWRAAELGWFNFDRSQVQVPQDLNALRKLQCAGMRRTGLPHYKALTAFL